MKKGFYLLLTVACLGASLAFAEGPKADVFKGKLFAPNIIMEQREALDLTKQQFTEIRAAVVKYSPAWLSTSGICRRLIRR